MARRVQVASAADVWLPGIRRIGRSRTKLDAVGRDPKTALTRQFQGYGQMADRSRVLHGEDRRMRRSAAVPMGRYERPVKPLPLAGPLRVPTSSRAGGSEQAPTHKLTQDPPSAAIYIRPRRGGNGLLRERGEESRRQVGPNFLASAWAAPVRNGLTLADNASGQAAGPCGREVRRTLPGTRPGGAAATGPLSLTC